MDKITKKLSVVLSVYNEEKNISVLIPKLISILETLPIQYEIIAVNDGSNDDSLQMLKTEQKSCPHLQIVNFTRNFGHEVAMSAGMDHATGEAVLFMDSDMQNPPSVAKQMIEKWLEGYEIVLSKRKEYNRGALHSFLTWIFYKVFNFLSDVKFDKSYPDFRLVSRKYVNRLKQITERERMFRCILTWVGITEHAIVEFDTPNRLYGKSSYNIFSYLNLGVNGILQFSIKPLRIITVGAILCCVMSIFYAIYVFFDHIIRDQPQNGFATIIIFMIVLFSVQTFVMALIGEYVGRIHMEVKKRPLYFADVIKSKDESK